MMIRSKEQLAVIRVYQGALVVETIHFPDEVRSTKDVPNIPEQSEEIGKKELDTAKLLIEQLTTEFEPEKYQDDYRIKLEALIAEKLSAEEVTVSEEQKSTPDNVTDIMEALEKSINRAKKNQPKPKTKKKKPLPKSQRLQRHQQRRKKSNILKLNTKKTASKENPFWLFRVGCLTF